MNATINALKPAKHTHKLLISSPAHFVGEYESEHFLLTHAWPSSGKRSIYAVDTASPNYRTFLVVAFSDQHRNREIGKFETLPNYSYVADVFCVFLGIYFGKRFDNQGCFETNGHFCLPHAGGTPTGLQHFSAFSHKPRKDLALELNLHKLKPVAKILDSVFEEIVTGTPVGEKIELAFAAGKFYLQALQLVESDAEIAFLNLVTAGEVLSNGFNFSHEELFDEVTREMLQTIKEKAGEDTHASVISRMYQVRRKFRLTLRQLVNDHFFLGSESAYPFAALKKDDFEARLNAAYDLRSRYLHTGARFGVWIEPDCVSFVDVMLGKPVVEPADWRKILSTTPTFTGLERTVRYCLLRFIHLHIVPIDERLN